MKGEVGLLLFMGSAIIILPSLAKKTLNRKLAKKKKKSTGETSTTVHLTIKCVYESCNLLSHTSLLDCS